MKQIRYYRFLNNLADPLRIRIIECLIEKDKNVSTISEELKEEQSKLSHSLSKMRRCNILNARKEGKKIIYSLNNQTIRPLFRIIDQHAKINCNKEECDCR